jgi:hypothetical protein
VLRGEAASGLTALRSSGTQDMQKLRGEAVGTFWLSFAGCGTAVIAAIAAT